MQEKGREVGIEGFHREPLFALEAFPRAHQLESLGVLLEKRGGPFLMEKVLPGVQWQKCSQIVPPGISGFLRNADFLVAPLSL